MSRSGKAGDMSSLSMHAMVRQPCIPPPPDLVIPGETYLKADHMDDDAGWGSYFPWGSFMVKPGCTLYMFREEEFAGSR